MHGAHQVTQYGAVTDPGIEQAQGGWRRPKMCEFLRRTFRHAPLLVTGIYKGQVLLAVIVESKRAIIGEIMFQLLILPCLVGLQAFPGSSQAMLLQKPACRPGLRSLSGHW
jgi:hypothetical protein